MEKLFVIAGLGNPGSRFENTRHNVGFEVIDLLSGKYGIKVNKVKHKALIGEGTVEGSRVLLVKPQTFMNLSGESIRDIVEWYKLPPEQLVITYDDVDLPVGGVRIRAKGSAGTHNGMRSVIYQLQSDEFPRIRIGIGKNPPNWELADYVLGRFAPDDRKLIDEAVKKAGEAAAAIVSSGVNLAMNRYNV